GKDNLPDYAQVFTDLLFKYKGLSFLAEYANASATGLDQPYTDATGTTLLAPQQISEYLVLGDSYNLALGYVTTGGYSFDVRYGSNQPEFSNYTNSLLQDTNGYSLGVTKY